MSSAIEEKAAAAFESHEEEPQSTAVELQGDVPIYLTDFMTLLVDKQRFSDVDFLVGPDGSEPRVIPAHRLVLAVSSPLFENMLYRNELDVLGHRVSVRVTDTSVDIFLILLKCIYTDVVDVNANNLPALIEVGKKYQIEKILDSCAAFLKNDIR